jgi:putative NADPH-quinone reductase
VPHILVLEAHPDAGRFNGALADAYAKGAASQGATVTRLALRDLAFDPILRGGFRGGQALEPDLQRARSAIEAATHVVIVTPVWWGSLPALLRGFVDRTFLPGWAFEHRGGPLPEGLLAGRTARVIATMDSPWWWYGLYHLRSAHRSLIQATLHYVGIKKVAQTTVYAVRKLDDAGRAAAIRTAEAAGQADG